MADPPHILKNLRAGLCNGNEIILPNDVVEKEGLPGNKVTLAHVRTLLQFQEPLLLKVAPKLRARDISPAHFDKMSVGSALRVFSTDVVAGLRALVQKYNYDQQMLVTAWFLEKVTKWFKLMTSRDRKLALSRNVMPVYEQSIATLKSVQSLFQNVKIGKNGKFSWKPVQTGVVLSTATILKLQEKYLDSGLPFLLTSRFTQDKLENFFSLVRGKNRTPDALEFKNCLKAITLSQYLKDIRGSSYQYDDSEFIADLMAPTKAPSNLAKGQDEDDEDCAMEDFVSAQDVPKLMAELEEDEQEELSLQQLASNFSSASNIPALELELVYHVTGYIIFQVLKTNKLCMKCTERMTSSYPEVEQTGLADLVHLKDYTGSSLKYCSVSLFENLFKPLECYFRQLEKSPNMMKNKSLTQKAVEYVLSNTTNVLPNCHQAQSKLATTYSRFRLKLSANHTFKQSQMASSKDKGERGSRCMTMKKSCT